MKYQFAGNAWTATDKSGTTYEFGIASSSREDNPANGSQVYKWMLNEVRDPSGNYTKYEYTKDNGQIYPKDIIYTGNGTTDGPFEVDFLTENRPDTPTSFVPGFAIQSNFLIQQIQTKINGVLSRTYTLNYATSTSSSRSLLQSITESGKDDTGNTVTLPPTQFSYTSDKSGYSEDFSFDPSDEQFEATSHLAYVTFDVNGDGFADVVKSAYPDIVPGGTVYLNNGDSTGWTQSSTWTIPSTFIIHSDSGTGYTMGDFNGDGYIDLFEDQEFSGAPAPGPRVYINNKVNGWVYDPSFTPPTYTEYVTSTNHSGFTAADVNGDGFADLIGTYNLNHFVYINNGNGTWSGGTWIVPSSVHFEPQGGGDNQLKALLSDLNGDGLVDIVYEDGYPTGTTHVLINNGVNGWDEDVNWVIPSNGDWTHIDHGAALVDVNQDGLPDLLQRAVSDRLPGVPGVYLQKADGTGWSTSSDPEYDLPYDLGNPDYGYSFFSNETGHDAGDLLNIDPFGGVVFNDTTNDKNDVLNAITYPTGGKENIVYQESNLYSNGSGLLNPALPLSVNTIHQISTDDGFGNASQKTYSYAGGEYYFASSSPLDKRFSGFNSVAETDASSSVTTSYFHQGNGTASSTGEYNDDEAKIGKPYRIETTDASGNPFSTQIDKWDDASRGGLAKFVKRIQSIILSYGPSGDHSDKAETYAYNDANGDLTERTEWGQVNANNDGSFTDIGTDKFVNDTSYAASSTSPLSVPDQTTTVDQSGNVVRQTTDYYDNLPLGSVSAGNLTKELKWITGTSTAEADTIYNSYGLPTQTKDADGNSTNYSYDAYNLYPATTTDALGYTSTALYDYSAGKPKQTTNENGVTFKTIFDGLDRVLEQDEPDPLNPSSSVPKTKYVYTDTGMPHSVLETDYLNSSTTTVSYTYLDGLDRTVQKLTEAEGTHKFNSTIDIYDARGLLHSESLPYQVNKSTFTALTNPPASSLLTTYTYDALKRAINIKTNVGSSTNVYDAWKTTTIDPDGHAKDYLNDPYGNLLQVVEHNNDGNYTTNYVYDGNNNLMKLTDANGNVRDFAYDGLSRRTSAEDLHTATSTFGTWTYTFDAAGNLTKQKDPKNQTTNFTYDALNRPLTEDFTGGAGTEVSYGYDTCAYGKLRLCTATTSAAITSYTYTPLGATASEKQVIGGQSFTTSYAYDRLGNKTGITYPDGSLVSYIYNAAGELESITELPSGTTTPTTIVSNFDYAPNGKVSYELFGNGVATTNTYDSTKLYRLTQILTVASTTPGQAPALVPKAKSASSTSPLPSVSTATTTASTSSVIDTPAPAPATTTPAISSPNLSFAPAYLLSDDPVEDTDIGTDTTTPAVDVPPVDTVSTSTTQDSADSSDSASSTPVVSTAPEATSAPDTTGSSTLPAPITGPTVSTTTASTTALTVDVLLPPTSTTIQNINYVYDPAGNITNVYDYSSTQAAHVTTFTYDYLNRLKSASTTAASTTPYAQTYTYDKVGNITNKSDLGAYLYTGASYADPDAVTRIGSAYLRYDKDGNLTSYSSTAYAWDYRNRLMSVAQGTGTSTYGYDYQNNRVMRTVSTTTTLYPNDLYNVSSSTAVRNIFDTSGTLITTLTGTSTLSVAYVHPDNLGSTNVTTDGTGSTTEVSDYYPYGSQRLDSGAPQQRKYIGEEYDGDTALSYLNARYYDGTRGQFLSQDPVFWNTKQNLQDPQSLNAYSYAENNPVVNKDPSGKCLEDACVIETAFAVSYIAVNYGPEIAEFAESLATPLGQTAIYDSVQSAQNGHPFIAVAELATAGDASVLHTTPEAARSMLQSDSALCEGVCGMSSLPSLANISSANKAFADFFETSAGKDIASKMFREGDQFPGGTAAALRFETQTGTYLSPAGHGIKAQNTLNQFNNALSGGILSPNDIARLSPKLDELSSALKSFNNKFNK